MLCIKKEKSNGYDVFYYEDGDSFDSLLVGLPLEEDENSQEEWTKMELNYITFIQEKFNFSHRLASQIFEWSVEQAKHDRDKRDKARDEAGVTRPTLADLEQARKGMLLASDE